MTRDLFVFLLSSRSEQTSRAFNALGRTLYLDLDKSEGYIVGIEKYKREDIGAPRPWDQKRFAMWSDGKDDDQIPEQNSEFIRIMDDPKPMMVTHIVSYFLKRDHVYHAYDENYNNYKGTLKNPMLNTFHGDAHKSRFSKALIIMELPTRT